MQSSRKALLIAAGTLIAFGAAAQEKEPLLDEKTKELTHRGLAIQFVAAAQVLEMRCGLKGEISTAIANVAEMGVVVDPNEKEDYSDIVFMATNVLTQVDRMGASVWCKNQGQKLAQFLAAP